MNKNLVYLSNNKVLVTDELGNIKILNYVDKNNVDKALLIQNAYDKSDEINCKIKKKEEDIQEQKWDLEADKTAMIIVTILTSLSALILTIPSGIMTSLGCALISSLTWITTTSKIYFNRKKKYKNSLTEYENYVKEKENLQKEVEIICEKIKKNENVSFNMNKIISLEKLKNEIIEEYQMQDNPMSSDLTQEKKLVKTLRKY